MRDFRGFLCTDVDPGNQHSWLHVGFPTWQFFMHSMQIIKQPLCWMRSPGTSLTIDLLASHIAAC